ncbi:hypothetical protein U1Q18_034113 [Sarracenia purpurea var. burkii]
MPLPTGSRVPILLPLSPLSPISVTVENEIGSVTDLGSVSRLLTRGSSLAAGLNSGAGGGSLPGTHRLRCRSEVGGTSWSHSGSVLPWALRRTVFDDDHGSGLSTTKDLRMRGQKGPDCSPSFSSLSSHGSFRLGLMPKDGKSHPGGSGDNGFALEEQAPRPFGV